MEDRIRAARTPGCATCPSTTPTRTISAITALARELLAWTARLALGRHDHRRPHPPPGSARALSTPPDPRPRTGARHTTLSRRSRLSERRIRPDQDQQLRKMINVRPLRSSRPRHCRRTRGCGHVFDDMTSTTNTDCLDPTGPSISCRHCCLVRKWPGADAGRTGRPRWPSAWSWWSPSVDRPDVRHVPECGETAVSANWRRSALRSRLFYGQGGNAECVTLGYHRVSCAGQLRCFCCAR